MGKRVKSLVLLAVLVVGSFILIVLTGMFRDNAPALGRDALQEVTILEDHREALAHWLGRGIKNAILINLDAHDDLRKISAGQLAHLQSVFQQKQGERPYTISSHDHFGEVTNSNFIHAAARLGIIKKVYWVVPSGYDLLADGGGNLMALLKLYGFTNEEIRSFRKKNGCFVGKTDGIPLVICDLATLPTVQEPVLLSIDADFFPPMVETFDYKIGEAVKQTFRALADKGYRIRDAVVAYSVNEGYLDTCYRWTGDLAIDLLRAPGILSQAELPWRYSFLQQADLLLLTSSYRELLDFLAGFQAGHPDPSVFAYAAQAYHGIGDLEESFRCAEMACQSDNSYCAVLPELGTAILEESGLPRAERFFARGYKLKPGLDHSQFRYAMALKSCGRYDDAIRYLNIFRDNHGSFPVDFYLGEIFLLKDDERSALRHFDSCRRAVANNPAVLAGFGDIMVIERAADFLERKGYVRHAAELKTSLKTIHR